MQKSLPRACFLFLSWLPHVARCRPLAHWFRANKAREQISSRTLLKSRGKITRREHSLGAFSLPPQKVWPRLFFCLLCLCVRECVSLIRALVCVSPFSALFSAAYARYPQPWCSLWYSLSCPYLNRYSMSNLFLSKFLFSNRAKIKTQKPHTRALARSTLRMTSFFSLSNWLSEIKKAVLLFLWRMCVCGWSRASRRMMFQGWKAPQRACVHHHHHAIDTLDFFVLTLILVICVRYRSSFCVQNAEWREWMWWFCCRIDSRRNILPTKHRRLAGSMLVRQCFDRSILLRFLLFKFRH